MQTSIETRVNGAPPATIEPKGSWGSEGVDDADILIPRLLLMQGLSKQVSSGKAALGDILRSTSGEVLAAKTKSLDVIPLTTFKTWVLEEFVAAPKGGGKWEFRGIVPMTGENKDAPLEWKESDKEWRRSRSLNFYVLLPEDIKKEVAARKAAAKGDMIDPDDALLPVLLSFRRSSYQAGRELATHFKKAEHFGVPPASSVFSLGSEVKTNDLGTFHIFKLAKARKSTQEELTVARSWYTTLQKARVAVHDEGEEDAVPANGDVVNDF